MLELASPKFKAASWLLIVYLLGIAIGAVAGQLAFSRVHASTSVRLTAQARRTQSVERLAREANLTDVQRQSLNRILSDTLLRFDAIHQQTDARISQLRTHARGEIRAILTPEQRLKYDECLRRLDEDRAAITGRRTTK